MNNRANFFLLAENPLKLLMQQEQLLEEVFIQSDNLSLGLLELLKIRVSQINKCAFCLDMHIKKAIEAGETTERLLVLNVWREIGTFSVVEKAMLEWIEWLAFGETITDVKYNEIQSVLGESAIVHVTLAYNAITSWNCIAKTFKPEIGSV